MSSKQGGSLLGQGAYGCVFGPALACKSQDKKLREENKTKDTVSKVFSQHRKSDMEEEVRITKIINDIDPASEFTIKYYGACDIDFRKVGMPTVKDCRSVDLSQYKKENRSHVQQIIYANGGIDMHAFCTSYAVKHSVMFDDIIVMVLPIMRGIATMNRKNWIHFDIKPPNMLYNDKEKRMYLIDFGLTRNATDASANLPGLEYLLSWPYLYYPPEFRIMSRILKGKDVIGADMDFFTDLKKSYGTLARIGIDEHDSGLRRMMDAARKNPAAFREAFAQKYLYKVDVYSLGMAINEIIYMLSRFNAFHTSNKAFVDEFKGILSEMTSLNVNKRLSAKRAYEKTRLLIQRFASPTIPIPITIAPKRIKNTCPRPRRPDNDGRCLPGSTARPNKHAEMCCYKDKKQRPQKT